MSAPLTVVRGFSMKIKKGKRGKITSVGTLSAVNVNHTIRSA